ncbi:MAG: SRPBCC domain-containing protein [Myxococcota bacterium]|nr:SRPBCC domain-containing protein [Myxococcota bacterium]
MSIVIPISISLNFYTQASIQDVFELLSDVPRSVSHFPNVEKLVALGDEQYRWEMEKMGSQNYHFQVKYTTRYQWNESERWIRWYPMSEGNGAFSGCWQLHTEGEGTRIHFENDGHIQLPIPRLAKRLVKPFVSRTFQELCDIYIANLQQTFARL